jgi:hypothetical protein
MFKHILLYEVWIVGTEADGDTILEKRMELPFPPYPGLKLDLAPDDDDEPLGVVTVKDNLVYNVLRQEWQVSWMIEGDDPWGKVPPERVAELLERLGFTKMEKSEAPRRGLRLVKEPPPA